MRQREGERKREREGERKRERERERKRERKKEIEGETFPTIHVINITKRQLFGHISENIKTYFRSNHLWKASTGRSSACPCMKFLKLFSGSIRI